MIIPIIDFLAPIITFIFNFSISSSAYPDPWKDAQVIPLPKKCNPTYLSDYRPISILPFLSKVLERLVHQQLNFYLSRNCLLNPLQSGFRPGHSTATALTKITDDIRYGMDNRQCTVLALLDFSNAFSSVDFDILLGILRSLNVSPNVVDWFHSYLYGRRQRVCIKDNYSSWIMTTAGVPQGGVLSPLLFALFINTITSHISSLYHLYADDLQIYTQSTVEDLPSAVSNINTDLSSILNWSTSYGLQLNPCKSQAIIIGSSRLTAKVDFGQLPPILFNGIQIPYTNVVKNLGILVDSSLSWGPQIGEVSRKVFATVATLRRLQYFLPIPTKIALAQSLFLPILDYADICYLDVNEEQLNKLERLQNLIIRFIFGLRKYDHISEYRKKLKWLPIRFRRNTHILSALYCVLFDPAAPSYLKERFEFLYMGHDHSLRSSNNLCLRVPPHSCTFYKKSFTNFAVSLWNSLPLPIRLSPSIKSFKISVKTHFQNL